MRVKPGFATAVFTLELKVITRGGVGYFPTARTSEAITLAPSAPVGNELTTPDLYHVKATDALHFSLLEKTARNTRKAKNNIVGLFTSSSTTIL